MLLCSIRQSQTLFYPLKGIFSKLVSQFSQTLHYFFFTTFRRFLNPLLSLQRSSDHLHLHQLHLSKPIFAHSQEATLHQSKFYHGYNPVTCWGSISHFSSLTTSTTLICLISSTSFKASGPPEGPQSTFYSGIYSLMMHMHCASLPFLYT